MKNLTLKTQNKKAGFTIFFAMLVGSLSLAVGLAIYDLTVREIDLSSTATQSQYAIYASDSGAECALYWDSFNAGYEEAYSGSSSFATSTASLNYPNSHMPSSGITCSGQDVAVRGMPPATFVLPNGTWSAWDTSDNSSTHAVTVFTLVLGTTLTSPCAVVEVHKEIEDDAPKTVIISRGYNKCQLGGLRVERALRVSY